MSHRIRNILASITCLGAVATASSAQVVTVTPANQLSNGFVDNSTNGSAAITAAAPHDGTGSLQLNISGSASQASFYSGAATGNTAVTGLLSKLTTFSGDYLQDLAGGSPSDPVFRFYLSNIGGTTSTASMGWYATAQGPDWQSSGNLATSGDFFFRISGAGGGQVADGCGTGSRAGSFDDRRQTIGDWLAACNGANGTFDLTNATITAVEIDQGTFPNYTQSNTSYADDFSVAYNGGAGVTYNFEATTTPEPSSMALLGTGLFALVPMIRRRRK